MIDPRNLKKKDVLLHAEGPLLTLFENPHGEFYFSAFLSISGGYVFFPVSDTQFKSFLNSEVTIRGIYDSVDHLLIKRVFNGEAASFLKDGLQNEITFADKLFKNLSDGMKNLPAIEKYM